MEGGAQAPPVEKDAARLLRELVTEVKVAPNAKGEPASIDIIGNLAAFMRPEAIS